MLYICGGNIAAQLIILNFMFKVFISFCSDDSDQLNHFGLSSSMNKEFFVGSSEDVCRILCSLSHLKPIVTLQEVSVVNADEVLKYYESKQV